eukprot:6958973-Lingulodinium_polyedra.AAC.1
MRGGRRSGVACGAVGPCRTNTIRSLDAIAVWLGIAIVPVCEAWLVRGRGVRPLCAVLGRVASNIT